MLSCHRLIVFFFFNDTATTEIYTLSLHDALPISYSDVFNELAANFVRFVGALALVSRRMADQRQGPDEPDEEDRKSTRLNSSHLVNSYAVFCLKKKKTSTIGHTSVTALHHHIPDT